MGGLAAEPRARDGSVLKEGRVVPGDLRGVPAVTSCDIWGLCSKPQSLIFWNWKIPSWAQPRLLEGLKHQNQSSP